MKWLLYTEFHQVLFNRKDSFVCVLKDSSLILFACCYLRLKSSGCLLLLAKCSPTTLPNSTL